MNPSRRDFMKDAAVMGAVTAVGVSGAEEAVSDVVESEETRCPYFDQPMYCKGLSKNGKPLCEE